jgi:sigma-E factor negative regulatory protein RseA
MRDVAPRRARWSAGAAIAAGCLLVVGTFALVRTSDSPAPQSLAQADGIAAQPVIGAAPQPAAIGPEVVVVDSRLVRDAQLDSYLAAHKQFAGTSALGVPSAFLRSATVDSSAR